MHTPHYFHELITCAQHDQCTTATERTHVPAEFQRPFVWHKGSHKKAHCTVHHLLLPDLEKLRLPNGGPKLGRLSGPPVVTSLSTFCMWGPKMGTKSGSTNGHLFLTTLSLQHSHKPHARHARARVLAQEVTEPSPPGQCTVKDASRGPRSGPHLFGGQVAAMRQTAPLHAPTLPTSTYP